MSTIRRYRSPVPAQAAVALLRRRGIQAVMVTDRDPFGGVGVTTGYGTYAVVIQDPSRRAEARRILAADSGEDEPPPGWEEQSRPDLSRLAGRPDAPCPECGRELPLDSAVERCPHCGAAADVVQVLLERHGPEVLAPCYPESEDDMPEDMVRAARLRCPHCDYSLDGLPGTGYCPECGQPYSKRDMLRG